MGRSYAKYAAMFGMLTLLTCGRPDVIDVEKRGESYIESGNVLERLVTCIPLGELASIDVTSSKELDDAGVQRHQVDSVKLRSFEMTIRSPQGQDFDFLESLEVFVEQAQLPTKKVASGSGFEKGSTIRLDTEDEELVEYATRERMRITTRSNGKSPPVGLVIDAVVHLDVDVNVAGVACPKN